MGADSRERVLCFRPLNPTLALKPIDLHGIPL